MFYSVLTDEGPKTLSVKEKHLVEHPSGAGQCYRGVVSYKGERRYVYSQNEHSFTGMQFIMGENALPC